MVVTELGWTCSTWPIRRLVHKQIRARQREEASWGNLGPDRITKSRPTFRTIALICLCVCEGIVWSNPGQPSPAQSASERASSVAVKKKKGRRAGREEEEE